MHERDLGQLALFIAALLLVTPPLGAFMARLFGGQRHFLQPVLGWLESAIYRVAGVDAQREMSWTTYAAALLVFNLARRRWSCSCCELTQEWLPLNPQHLPNVPFALALNTAVRFMTNTNWQATPAKRR